MHDSRYIHLEKQNKIKSTIVFPFLKDCFDELNFRLISLNPNYRDNTQSPTLITCSYIYKNVNRTQPVHSKIISFLGSTFQPILQVMIKLNKLLPES